jgi:SAM-dependent methyltransferase
MAHEDQIRWNKKYLNNPPMSQEPIDLVRYYYVLANRGNALDIACGMGRHSRFLAQNDFYVDALDISPVALQKIKNIANIDTHHVDLDDFRIDEDSYDLIVCTYYLNRDIFTTIIEGLKNEAILIYETFVHHPDNTKVPSKPEFLLQSNELKEAFEELEIIFYEEWWDTTEQNNKALKASLVAKKR